MFVNTRCRQFLVKAACVKQRFEWAKRKSFPLVGVVKETEFNKKQVESEEERIVLIEHKKKKNEEWTLDQRAS